MSDGSPRRQLHVDTGVNPGVVSRQSTRVTVGSQTREAAME